MHGDLMQRLNVIIIKNDLPGALMTGVTEQHYEFMRLFLRILPGHVYRQGWPR